MLDVGLSLKTPVVGSGWNFAPEVSKLCLSLSLRLSLRLLVHYITSTKIDLEVPSFAESIQNSTLTQGRWENVQETWQHCQVIKLKTT